MQMMKPSAKLTNFIKWRYSHYVICFTAGASLELFMNFFHVGEANIYRSIRKSLSTSSAEKRFEAEKFLYERVMEPIDSKQKTLALADLVPKPALQPKRRQAQANLSLAARSLVAGGK